MNWRKAADITRTNTNDSMIGVRSAAAGGYTILILTRDPEDLANSLIVSSFYNRTTRRQDVVELAFTGKLVDLFTGYRVLLPQQSRIWKAVPASLNGIFHYAPKEFWFSFYVNTTVIDKINPLYVIWYANDGVPPNSWDDFAADPNMAERYELPSTSMNETGWILNRRTTVYYCKMAGIMRYNVFHWSVMFIENGIYFFLIFVVVTLQLLKKQPLLSKGIIPVLALISQVFQMIPQCFFLFADIETNSKTWAFLYPIFMYTWLILAVWLLPLNLFRFIIVLNINKLKGMYRIQIRTNSLTGEKMQQEKVRWQFRILKLLSAWWVTMILVVFMVFMWICLVIIIYAAYSFLSSDGIEYATSVLYIVFVICIFVLVAACMIYDFAINAKKIFGCEQEMRDKKRSIIKKFVLWDYFIETDPFLFRLETVLFLVPLFIFFVIWSPINTFAGGGGYLTGAIIQGLLQNFLIWYQVGFPLIMTIVGIFRGLVGKKTEKEELNLILDDEHGRDIFTNFAKQEWSVENIALWDDIQDFLSEKGNTQRQYKAANIYFNYLNGAESKLEVNINKNLCNALKKKIDTEPELDNQIFNQILQAVKINLADTFSRLRLRNDYLSWKRTRVIQGDQMSGRTTKD